MKCATCGQYRVIGDIRWHPKGAEWHCQECLPRAGGYRENPGDNLLGWLAVLTILAGCALVIKIVVIQ